MTGKNMRRREEGRDPSTNCVSTYWKRIQAAGLAVAAVAEDSVGILVVVAGRDDSNPFEPFDCRLVAAVPLVDRKPDRVVVVVPGSVGHLLHQD